MNNPKSVKKSSLDRKFFEGTPKVSVLVELGGRMETYSPASMINVDQNVLNKLKNIVGTDPKPVFYESTQPVSVYGGNYYTAMAPTVESDPILSRFYEVPADTIDTANQLSKDIVSKMGSEVSEAIPVPLAIPAIGPATVEPAVGETATPDFRPLQKYLGPGPDGLNVSFSWQFPGGDGYGITVIDIEGGWRLTHENLANVRFNHWSGELSEGGAWLEHGTAVVGILAGTQDVTGVSGICPGARVGMVSIFESKEQSDQRVASQILKALKLLKPGDVMLIELQRPGPSNNFQPDENQKGYIPLDYWPDIRTAISRAVAQGICVVEVGGNGGVNLDDPVYAGRFDRTKNDSGAIFAGAGAPPGGAFGPARSRLDFSNYGSRFDCQAWGQMVTTSGYGDLWGGQESPDKSYTSRFMGTSSSAPMIAGIIACLQGRHKLVYGTPIPPQLMRYALNLTGWPQMAVTANENQRIGNQPDLYALYRFFRLIG